MTDHDMQLYVRFYTQMFKNIKGESICQKQMLLR